MSELWIRVNYQVLKELIQTQNNATLLLQTALDEAAADPDRCNARICHRDDCPYHGEEEK